MLSLKSRSILGIVLPTLCLLGCNQTKFRGGQGARSENKTTEVPNACQNESANIGGDVLMVIDNSASNAKTDPEMQRTSAVLSLFDLMAKNDPSVEQNPSRLGIVAFPTRDDIYAGSEKPLASWTNIESSQRGLVKDSLEFAADPVGMTPYGAGLTAAEDMLQDLNDASRKRLVVIVSDGEPTDREPSQAVASANRIKKQYNAELVTILVTEGKERAQRLLDHEIYLSSNGYDQAVIEKLVGGRGKKDLVSTISDRVYEVSAMKDLENELSKLVASKINCK